MGTCQQKLQLNLLEYFKISDTYVNMDNVKVFIHFLIFRVEAESEGHEHGTLSFFIQDSEHSLFEFECLVYQI